MSFLKALDDKYKIVAFDDEEEHDEEEAQEDDEPQEDDIFITSTGHLGSQTSLSAGGKHIGNFKDDDAVQKAIVDWMNKNKWYPNIWQVSDHGNTHSYTLDDKYQKMVK